MTGDRSAGGSAVAERPTVPKVDPRLRARRIEVRRREGRRRLRRLLIAVAITVVSVGAWGVTRSPLLDVDHFEIEGLDRLDAAAVIDAGGIAMDDPLVEVDLDRAQAGIEELAWVESVEVSRSWRGTIRYVVTERRPGAVLAGDASSGPWWLVDHGGWILGPAMSRDRELLAAVEGLEVPPVGERLDPGGRDAVSLATAITVGLEPWVEAVVVDAAGEYWLRLARSATDPSVDHDFSARPSGSEPSMIRLGDTLEVTQQIIAAETVLTKVDLSCLATIDARVAAAPTVTRHPGCDLT